MLDQKSQVIQKRNDLLDTLCIFAAVGVVATHCYHQLESLKDNES